MVCFSCDLRQTVSIFSIFGKKIVFHAPLLLILTFSFQLQIVLIIILFCFSDDLSFTVLIKFVLNKLKSV